MEENKVKSAEEIVENSILNEELDGVVGMASVHGWKSNLVKAGGDARSKISELKSLLIQSLLTPSTTT